MADETPAEVSNTINGGIQFGPVLQGRDVQAVFHLPAPAPVALAQLPAPMQGFTGRDDFLAVLGALLDPAQASGTVVVSAVAGLAGVGKTTLVVQAGHAARQQGWYPGGTLFLDLHGYDQPTQPTQALDALLRALGVPAERIPPGIDERAGLYRSILAEIREPVLVIADNASSEAQVRMLLPGAGPHTVLITSRHTLAGLDARPVDLKVLDDADAIALLDAALRAARPCDDRMTIDPIATARLVGACGGLPLALQIVASIIKADPGLTACDLADELADEQGRLGRLAYDDGSGATAPSVAAAFELSYRRLDEVSARRFRLLSVSPGPDVSTATAAILTGLPTVEARGLLAALARAHLMEAASVPAGRWRMHDLVRLYAQRLSDQHAEADGREQARDRLLAHYLDMAGAADDHLAALPGTAVPAQFANRDEALAWLDAERPNLTAAVALTASTGLDQIAMRLPLRLASYFGWRRRFDERLATATVSRDAARRVGDRAREAAALNNMGLALRSLRRFEEAVTAHQDAAAIYQAIGDLHGKSGVLSNLGLVLQQVQRFDEAIAAHQGAAAIFRETGDQHGEGSALGNLGSALSESQRFDEAILACHAAATIFRETGDRQRRAISLTNLGLVLQEVQRFDEAITAHQDAVTIFRETGDEHGEGSALSNLGLALQGAQRFDEAITAHQDAVTIFRETGDQHGEGSAWGNLGVVLQGVRRYDEAISAHKKSVTSLRETGDRHGEGMTLGNLGNALREAQRFDEAIPACQEAVAIFRETGDRDRQGIALDNLERAQAAQSA